MTNTDVKTLGERLFQLRNEKRLTQEELAERLMIGRQTISKWELNKSVPSTENLIQLAEIYEVSLDYLIKGQQSENEISDAQKDMEKVQDNEKSETENRSLSYENINPNKKTKWMMIPIFALIVVLIVIIFIQMFSSRDDKEEFEGFLVSERTQGALQDEMGKTYVYYSVPENYQLEFIDIREGVIVNKYDHTEKRIEVQIKIKHTDGQWTALEEMEQKTILWGVSKDDILTKDVNGYTVYYFGQNNLDTATEGNFRYRFNCAIELKDGKLYLLDCVGFGEEEAELFETFEDFLQIKE